MAMNKTKSVRPSLPHEPARFFTLDQANRALPLVRRIVADLVAEYAAVCAMETEAQRVVAADGPKASIDAMRDDYNRRVDHLRELAEELSDVGCELKDAQTGLIDFPARHDDRTVYLCWRLGEQTVEHWHELDAGVAGRQPIAELFALPPD